MSGSRRLHTVIQFNELKVCSERDELTSRVKSLKEMVKSLESELMNSNAALTAANEDVSRYRSKANQLQGIVESAERTRQQQQKGIKKQVNNMQEAQATITKLTSKTGKSGSVSGCINVVSLLLAQLNLKGRC